MAAVAARPLHVALLTSSRFWRGSSSVFAVLARGLAARGHTTTALAAYEPVAAGFRSQALAVRTLPVGHTNLKAARALGRALQELAADIVLVDRPRDLRHAAFASLGGPLAVVYCISTPRPPRDLLTRLAFRRVALTVFLSHQLARTALAEAARLAQPAPRLVLCGTGALEGSLRAHAGRLGLDVRFVGQMDSGELVGAYNAATCVVHTRPDEVFALALIEALACGRPLVASGGGGTPELVGDAGVLAPPHDPSAFARLLQDLLGDQKRRAALALAARRRALERYSVDRMVRDYAEVVEALVQGRGKP